MTFGGLWNRGNDAWRLLQLDHFKSYLEFQPNLRPISPLLLPHRMQNFLRASFEFDVALGKQHSGTTLAHHHIKPRLYNGCIKSGLVLARKEIWRDGK
ncbi:probable beta-1,3-galactosyltransferase 2 isoform X7 [Mangifera indica]|uniref:probable beta-1,3-galactosyltransferase 2 isoform X7 n=1 Tax=Mangifera indica TaxID=29780 RepID=UPI001CF9DA55|nr:probable beta-1,3-galactosyltransferase 2 isoform X7 [Mangifera indica]